MAFYIWKPSNDERKQSTSKLGLETNSLIIPNDINDILYQNSYIGFQLLKRLDSDDNNFNYGLTSAYNFNTKLTSPTIQIIKNIKTQSNLTNDFLYFDETEYKFYAQINNQTKAIDLTLKNDSFLGASTFLKTKIVYTTQNFTIPSDRTKNTPLYILAFGGGGNNAGGQCCGGGGGGHMFFQSYNMQQANLMQQINVTIGEGQPTYFSIYDIDDNLILSQEVEKGQDGSDSINKRIQDGGSGGSGGGGFAGSISGWNGLPIESGQGGSGTYGGGGGGGGFDWSYNSSNLDFILSSDNGKGGNSTATTFFNETISGGGGGGGGGGVYYYTDSKWKQIQCSGGVSEKGGNGGDTSNNGKDATNKNIVNNIIFYDNKNLIKDIGGIEEISPGGESRADTTSNKTRYFYGGGGGGGMCGAKGGQGGRGYSNGSYTLIIGGGGGGGGGFGVAGKGGDGAFVLEDYYRYQGCGGGGGGGFGAPGGNGYTGYVGSNYTVNGAPGGGGGYGAAGNGGAAAQPGSEIEAILAGIAGGAYGGTHKNPGGCGIFILYYYSKFEEEGSVK